MTSERLKDWKRYQRTLEIARLLGESDITMERLDPPMARPIGEMYIAANCSRLVRWSDGHVEEIPDEDLLPDRREPPVPAPIADMKRPKSPAGMMLFNAYLWGIWTGLLVAPILIKVFS